MAACKSSIDKKGVVKIPSASLPVTCKLQDPLPGVTLAEVEFFPSGSTNGFSYPITAGQSFAIPGLPPGTKGRLFARITGDYPQGTTIYVVEDCDKQSRILAITDRFAKYASAPLEVS